MRTRLRLTTGLVFAILVNPGLRAAEPSPESAGLQKTAGEFVTAFNKKDAGGLAGAVHRTGRNHRH